MKYKAPDIRAGRGATRELANLQGAVTVVSMPEPWDLLQEAFQWAPDVVHMVEDMDLATLEELERTLPACDTVVGIGGGSCCDTAKFIAWKRGCRMVLVPSIVSVDAPLTDSVGVRVGNVVKYVGKIFPEELIVDYDLIQKAPKPLNRAGAGDIASIHTALFDWQLAHRNAGEAYDERIAALAETCLKELDAKAEDIYEVSPAGIDAIVDLYRREVAFCAELGSSRPEEGSEHIVAYNMEHLTKRHFIHGDLVALGIFTMARLQDNAPDWIENLMRRLGLRFKCPDASVAEIENCLNCLEAFKRDAEMFYSVLDTTPVTPEFVEETVKALRRERESE